MDSFKSSEYEDESHEDFPLHAAAEPEECETGYDKPGVKHFSRHANIHNLRNIALEKRIAKARRANRQASKQRKAKKK
jgi:hypothetical protein